MATSFQKTYSVTVTISSDLGKDITENDIQAEDLRKEIQKEIAQVCTRSKGVYSAHPGTISES